MKDIRPIRTDQDHRLAMVEVDRLWDAQHPDDQDRLEVLSILIDAYERERWPTEMVEPVEAIKAHMALCGLTQSDLAQLLGSSSRASEVIHRRRRLSIDMIAKLVNAWKIPAEWLVQPYALQNAADKPTRRPLLSEMAAPRLLNSKRALKKNQPAKQPPAPSVV